MSRLLCQSLFRRRMPYTCNLAGRRTAASFFKFPAMSPTMEEGTITSWKVKVGDEFSAGDVLLEIETDKASMDVEAADDGILVKILTENGKVDVGQNIAVLGERGDDIEKLELPKDEEKKSDKDSTKNESSSKEADKSKSESKKKTTDHNNEEKENKPKSKPKGEKADAPSASKSKRDLSPSVLRLINQNDLQDKSDEIKATGPNGRILKGDVLVYLGQVKKESLERLEKSIKKLEKLDLSNIKIAQKKEEKGDQKKTEITDKVPEIKLISKDVDFSSLLALRERINLSLGVDVSVSHLLNKASLQSLSSMNGTRDLFEEIISRPIGIDGIEITSPFDLSTTTVNSTEKARLTFRPKQLNVGLEEKRHVKEGEVDIIDFLGGISQSAIKKNIDIAIGIQENPNVYKAEVTEFEGAEGYLRILKDKIEKPVFSGL